MPDISTTAAWYSSPYYRLLNASQYDKRREFINKIFKLIGLNKDSKVVEAYCGTGTFSKVIADLGFDVTGIDPFADNVTNALNLQNDKLHFFQHDIRLPFWINYFDVVINLFASFGFYDTLREHDNAIRVLSQSLKLNGLFVVDYLNVRPEENSLKEYEDVKVNEIEYAFLNKQDEESFYRQIEVKEQGEIKGVFSVKTAKFTIGDFTDMFAYQGLQIQEVFGDYNLSNYDIRNSRRLIFIAKKIRR